MKINKIKALVGVLATSAVVSLVGSISGTVAWLQYNTRARVEMYGTTAKTTENLQIRTVTNYGVTGTAAVAKAADKANIPAGSYSNNDLAITDEGKVYTYVTDAWNSGAVVSNGDKYDVGGTIYNWNGSAWAEVETTYGDWKSALLPADINAAADHKLTDDVFLPLTNPAAAKDGALGTFYNHPVAGHELYDSGTYKWKRADAGYLQFTVQFRVLDIDGKAANIDLAQALYMTDFQINDVAADGKSVKEALRFHIKNNTVIDNKLYGLQGTPDGTESFTTVTHGHLDLDGDGDYDTKADVPQKYSWDDNSTDLLDYGGAGSEQTYFNMSRTGTGTDTFFAVPDNYGGLTKTAGVINGTSIGTTVAGTEGSGVGEIADEDHLTFTFTMWLEGWHTMERNAADASKGTFASVADHAAEASPVIGKMYADDAGLALHKMFLYMGLDSNSDPIWKDVALQAGDVYYNGSAYQVVNADADGFEAAGAKVQSALWDDLKTVGAKFNIGMSFGVPALEPIQE